jgi:hypothetical protein
VNGGRERGGGGGGDGRNAMVLDGKGELKPTWSRAISNTSSNARNESSLRTSSFSQTPCIQSDQIVSECS